MARSSSRQEIRRLTLSALLCALGVLILALGSLFEVVDLTVAVLASFLCVWAVIELGGVYPWMVWAVTSVVALLLLPLKTPALFYAIAFGFYPIVKEKAEKRSTVISWVIKLVTLHVSLALSVLGLWLLTPALFEGTLQILLLIGFYVACLVLFVIYDVALTRVITLYLVRFRHRFRIK